MAELSDFSVQKIKTELKRRGLSTKGKRDSLEQRLASALAKEKTEDTEVEEIPASGSEETVCTKNHALDLIRRKEKILKLDIKTVVESINQLNESSERDAVKMENRLSKLNHYREQCTDIRGELVASLSDHAVEDEATAWANYLNEVDNVIDLAQAYLSINSVSNNSGASTSDITKSNLKLPKLELPKFYGDVMKFQNFWDQFEAAVHTNETLPDVQKFTYLRSVLGGVAYQTIEGFEITGANYSHAVDTLKHRFGRKRLVISSLVKSIIKFEPKANMEAHTSLRELHDTLKNRIRALEGLNENPKDYTCILLPVFEMKLPPEISEKWELEISDMEDSLVDLDLFFKFLNKQVISKEAGQRSAKEIGIVAPKGGVKQNTISSGKRVNTKSEKFEESLLSTAAALLTEVSQGLNNTKTCHLCKTNGHGTPECPKFKENPVEERWRQVKEAKLCFNCLRPTNGNHYSQVCRQPKCGVESCKERHHHLLHRRKQEPDTFTGLVASNQDKSTQVLLQTTRASLITKDQTVPIRVLLDSGSQRSYITKKLADRLDLRGPTETLNVSTFGEPKTQTRKMRRVNISVGSIEGVESCPVEMKVLAVETICKPLEPVVLDITANSHLANLKFSERYPRGAVEVDILIGADYYFSFVNGECIKGSTPDTLTAINSTLGWIASGPLTSRSTSGTSVMFTSVCPDPVESILKNFWELDAIGIVDKGTEPSLEENDAVRQFREGLKFDGKRYEVSLPWRENHEELRDNYNQAIKRLESVEKQLLKNPTRAEAYKSSINQYHEKGFAEEIQQAKVPNEDVKLVRYLPHHAVFRENKPTTKCRVVFDASAREEDGVSLNDCVLPGPALQPNLVAVLLRFRTHKIGLMADIEKMFLQIMLAEKDRDVHRYVWRNMKIDKPPKVYRMTRVSFGVNCSPFLAIATVRNHAERFELEFPQAAKCVRDDMYVDDCLTGADDEEEAVKLQQSMTELMYRAAFNLTKWSSNSENVLNHIEEKDRAPNTLIDFSEKEPLKALGIGWNTLTDCFEFHVPTNRFLLRERETKRSMLSDASKLFDPMGILSPYTIRSKVMFQQLWSRGLQWDENLPEDIKQQWDIWKSELPVLNEICIPRSLMKNGKSGTSLQLHGFGDASPKAYGAVVYARVTQCNGDVETYLVMSKTRVAPTKVVSLPRLELLAAVINSRLLKFVSQSLSDSQAIERVVCWTDSEVTLHWIRGLSSQWKTFVANRVTEIQQTWDPQHWKHCPGTGNPADLLTRGITSRNLKENDLWWKGPSWLLSNEEAWPDLKLNQSSVKDARKESRAKLIQNLVTVSKKPVIEYERYERWIKLV